MRPSFALLLAPLALAAAVPKDLTKLLRARDEGDLTATNVPVPAPSQFNVPTNQTKNVITLGRGIQNYTCTDGKFVSIGAVANLFDISRLVDVPKDPQTIETVSKILPPLALEYLPFPLPDNVPVDIHHFFANLPGAAASSPIFASATNRVVGAKLNSVDAPNSGDDVAWLQLKAVPDEGDLASYVYRLFTAGGQPPATCSDEGSETSVQYAAMYFFTS